MVHAVLPLIFLIGYFDFSTCYTFYAVVWNLLQAEFHYLCFSKGLNRSTNITRICSNSISMHCIAKFPQKFKVGIILPPFCKCPDASDVVASITARCHANLRNGQNLLDHVISSEIGYWRLFFLSSN